MELSLEKCMHNIWILQDPGKKAREYINGEQRQHCDIKHITFK